MFNQKFKRILSALLAKVVLATSMLTAVGPAHAVYGEYRPKYRDMCSMVDCAFTYPVPEENWQEIALLHNPQGLRGRVDGRSLYSGERWMALGQESVGILGLSSADVVLKAWQGQLSNPPWVIARFVPELGQLRIHVVKTIKTPDGYQRVMVADYTPEHGRYDVARQNHLTQDEKRSIYVRGMDPYWRFAGDRTDPTFYNMTTGAAQVAVGKAMSHYRAPYAFFIESAIRMESKQSTSGNILRKKITTTTTGYAKPKIYLAAPLNMSSQRNSIEPSMMAVMCPRPVPCKDADQVIFSGFVLEELQGGNIPNIEEQIYRSVESQSSWTAIAFMLVTAALTWGAGAMFAGTGNWVVANGAVQAAGTALVDAGAIAGTTIATSAGMGYAAVNSLVNGGSVGSVQQSWLGSMGLAPEQVTYGTTEGATCTNKHCEAMLQQVSQRHIQSGNPGTANSGGNLAGTKQLMEGNCPLDWTIVQCRAQGLEPGQTQRTDSHTNWAMNSEVFERKRQACINAGYGSTQQTLYYCMVNAVYDDGTDGEQSTPLK